MPPTSSDNPLSIRNPSPKAAFRNYTGAVPEEEPDSGVLRLIASLLPGSGHIIAAQDARKLTDEAAEAYGEGDWPATVGKSALLALTLMGILSSSPGILRALGRKAGPELRLLTGGGRAAKEIPELQAANRAVGRRWAEELHPQTEKLEEIYAKIRPLGWKEAEVQSEKLVDIDREVQRMYDAYNRRGEEIRRLSGATRLPTFEEDPELLAKIIGTIGPKPKS